MDILVYDTNFNAVGIVDIFESIVWTDRYRGYGDFELYTEFNPSLLTLLKPDYYIKIKDSENHMIIESIEIKTDVEKGNKLIFRGRSLLSMLDRRIIFQRSVFNLNMTQDVITTLLLQNVISAPGQPQRNIPNFTYTNSADPLVLTPTVPHAEFYTENLYEIIHFLCERSNFGMKLVLNSSNQFVFSLYAGKDRSYSQSTNPYVVFSPNFDNLISSDYFYSKQTKKTIALISGDAYNGMPRPTLDFDPWENDTTDPHYPTIRTGLDRREVFVDAPDLSKIDPSTGTPFAGATYNQMMYERARQELNQMTEYEVFDGQISTTSGYTYGTDFFLGDIVQIEDAFGNKGRTRVVELTISENSSGFFTNPTYEKV